MDLRKAMDAAIINSFPFARKMVEYIAGGLNDRPAIHLHPRPSGGHYQNVNRATDRTNATAYTQPF